MPACSACMLSFTAASAGLPSPRPSPSSPPCAPSSSPPASPPSSSRAWRRPSSPTARAVGGGARRPRDRRHHPPAAEEEDGPAHRAERGAEHDGREPDRGAGDGGGGGGDGGAGCFGRGGDADAAGSGSAAAAAAAAAGRAAAAAAAEEAAAATAAEEATTARAAATGCGSRSCRQARWHGMARLRQASFTGSGDARSPPARPAESKVELLRRHTSSLITVILSQRHSVSCHQLCCHGAMSWVYWCSRRGWVREAGVALWFPPRWHGEEGARRGG